jgi:hypothetical protein
MPSVAPLRTADIAGLQGKRGNVSALPHNRRGKTLAVRLWHPLHILAGCDHNNKTATSRNARQEHPHNDGPKMSLAVTGEIPRLSAPLGRRSSTAGANRIRDAFCATDRGTLGRRPLVLSQGQQFSEFSASQWSRGKYSRNSHPMRHWNHCQSPPDSRIYLSLLLSHDLLLACTSATLIARNGKGATQR